MSTNDEAADVLATARFATLKRGRVYFLRDREFAYDVPQQVNAADEAWLKEHAVDEVTVEDEGEFQVRQKFEFTDGPVGDSADAPVSPRTRRR